MAEALILLLAVVLLLRICWTDFFFLKIRNRDLVILLVCAISYLAVAQPQWLFIRIGFGSILFGLGFIFWLFGKIGAGDAKLFGVAGCLVPPDRALVFAAMLFAISMLMYYLLFHGQVVSKVFPNARKRFSKLGELNRVPYGVAISLATIFSVAESQLAAF